VTCPSHPVDVQQQPTLGTSHKVPAAALYRCAQRGVQTAHLAHLGRMSKYVKLILWLL